MLAPEGDLEVTRADDGGRTRDLKLGKLALYQLSYVRVRLILRRGGAVGRPLDLT